MRFFRAIVNTFVIITCPLWIILYILWMAMSELLEWTWISFRNSSCYKGDKWIWEKN